MRRITEAETRRIVELDAVGWPAPRIAVDLGRAFSTVAQKIRALRDQRIIDREDRRKGVGKREGKISEERSAMPFGRCCCGSEVALMPGEADPIRCCNCRAARVERVIALRRIAA